MYLLRILVCCEWINTNLYALTSASIQSQIYLFCFRVNPRTLLISQSPPFLISVSPHHLCSHAVTLHNDSHYQEQKWLLNGCFAVRAQGHCWSRDSTISAPCKVILEHTFHQPTTPVWYNTGLFSASCSQGRIRKRGQERVAGMLILAHHNCSLEKSRKMLQEAWEILEVPKWFICEFPCLKRGQRVIDCFMTATVQYVKISLFWLLSIMLSFYIWYTVSFLLADISMFLQ